ncbi:MAG: M23 family metallopeptidase [Vampirovibrionales bacterium]|nr:M23 family metallopeptidase [Vampirovibrionales bacterium]
MGVSNVAHAPNGPRAGLKGRSRAQTGFNTDTLVALERAYTLPSFTPEHEALNTGRRPLRPTKASATQSTNHASHKSPKLKAVHVNPPWQVIGESPAFNQAASLQDKILEGSGNATETALALDALYAGSGNALAQSVPTAGAVLLSDDYFELSAPEQLERLRSKKVRRSRSKRSLSERLLSGNTTALRAGLMLACVAFAECVGSFVLFNASQQNLQPVTVASASAQKLAVVAQPDETLTKMFPLAKQESEAYKNAIAAVPQVIQPQVVPAPKKRPLPPVRRHVAGLMTPMHRFVFSSPFGMRSGRMHRGVDFAAPVGTPIYAAGDGVITAAGWDSGYGQAILVKHANGTVTRYAHCSQIYVSRGQRVLQGQRIAAVGNTGHSTGAHLHFEVLENGVAQNPMKRLGAFNATVVQANGKHASGV